MPYKTCLMLKILVGLYSSPNLPCYNEDDADEYAVYTCREILYERILSSITESKDKFLRLHHSNILIFMEYVTCSIFNDPYPTTEDHILARESTIKLWNTLVYDGNFLFYSNNMPKLHMSTARQYATLGKRDKTLEHLKMAKNMLMILTIYLDVNTILLV